jgi:hypothetical protein
MDKEYTDRFGNRVPYPSDYWESCILMGNRSAALQGLMIRGLLQLAAGFPFLS